MPVQVPSLQVPVRVLLMSMQVPLQVSAQVPQMSVQVPLQVPLQTDEYQISQFRVAPCQALHQKQSWHCLIRAGISSDNSSSVSISIATDR